MAIPPQEHHPDPPRRPLDRALTDLAHSVTGRRKAWIAGVVALSVLAVALGARLSYRHQASDFLPRPPGPPSDIEVAVRALVGGADRVVVILEGEKPLASPEVSPVLDSVAAALAALDGILGVNHRIDPELRDFMEHEGPEHLFLYLRPDQLEAIGDQLSREGIERALLGPSGGGDAGASTVRWPLMERDPLGVLVPVVQTVERALGNSRVRLVDGYYALPGEHSFFLTVQPRERLRGVEEARALVRGIETVLDGVRDDRRLADLLQGKHLVAMGRPVEYVEAFERAQADGRRVALASGVAVFFLLAVFFRRPLASLVLLSPVLVGLLLASAVAYVIFGTVNLLAWIFVAVLIGLGVDFGLHIATHYWIAGDVGGSRAEALASALRRPGRGIIVGGLTSVAAFSALAVLSYPVMTQIAVLTTAGLLGILAASFVVLPLGLSFRKPRRHDRSGWNGWTAMWYRLGVGHPRLGLAVWAVVLLGSLMAIRSLPIETHPWKIALRGLPQAAELDRIRQQLGSTLTPILMVSRGATRETALAADRAAVETMDRIGTIAGVAWVQSLSRWLPDPERQQANIAYIQGHQELFTRARFRRDFTEVVERMDDADPDLLNQYLPTVLRLLDPDPVTLSLEDLARPGLESLTTRHLLNADGGYLAVSYVFLRQFPWADGVVSRFREMLDRFGGEALAEVQFIGDPLLADSHQDVLRRDVALASTIAFLLVALILGIRFRRARYALLCLLPLVCGVSVALGFMSLVGIELNLLTLAIAPLLIGIGVDDGVHMVGRFEQGEDARTVLQEAGAAMTMTTLTTTAAFLCLGLASFAGIRELGLVGAVGLVVCLLASLHLVPIVFNLTAKASEYSPGPVPEPPSS